MKLLEMFENDQEESQEMMGIVYDEFLVLPEIVKLFSRRIKSQEFYSKVRRIVDPTASRALSIDFPRVETFDIDPKDSGSRRLNFLTTKFPYIPGILVIMNPPFGFHNRLAIMFFNHAATFADYIAQIVPMTWKRHSAHTRIDPHFKLVDEWALPRDSYYMPAEGSFKPYHFPAVGQIWERQAPPEISDEEVEQPESNELNGERFDFVQPHDADFAFIRRGADAGKIVTKNIQTTNPSTHFYIRARDNNVIKDFETVDWTKHSTGSGTAQNISQDEIVKTIK